MQQRAQRCISFRPVPQLGSLAKNLCQDTRVWPPPDPHFPQFRSLNWVCCTSLYYLNQGWYTTSSAIHSLICSISTAPQHSIFLFFWLLLSIAFDRHLKTLPCFHCLLWAYHWALESTDNDGGVCLSTLDDGEASKVRRPLRHHPSPKLLHRLFIRFKSRLWLVHSKTFVLFVFSRNIL